jgi:hypothetical protein
MILPIQLLKGEQLLSVSVKIPECLMPDYCTAFALPRRNKFVGHVLNALLDIQLKRYKCGSRELPQDKQ